MKVEPAKERLDAPTFTAVRISRLYAVRVLPTATEVAIEQEEFAIADQLVRSQFQLSDSLIIGNEKQR